MPTLITLFIIASFVVIYYQFIFKSAMDLWLKAIIGLGFIFGASAAIGGILGWFG